MIKNLELDIRFLLFKALCKHRGIFKQCEGCTGFGCSRYYNAFESVLLKKAACPLNSLYTTRTKGLPRYNLDSKLKTCGA